MTGTTGPRDSLSDYEFSFEAYLDYTRGIEVDVSHANLTLALIPPMLTSHSTVKSLESSHSVSLWPSIADMFKC